MSKKNKKNETIPVRLNFIKEMLKGNNLEPMVYIDGCETEAFINPYENSSDDNKSKDTKYILNKRKLNFYRTIRQFGGKLLYKKSGTTGHTFKGIINKNNNTINYGVKVVAYPKRENYGSLFNVERPENAELMMIRLLSYFVVKSKTPHIVLPITTFNTSIQPFINLIKDGIVDKDNRKYLEFVKRYKKGEYYDTVSILISEWANCGDLLDFIRKRFDTEFTPLYWKVFFFQIISVLAVIQSKYPSFRHNDLKANNILVQETFKQGTIGRYRVCKNKYIVPSIGYNLKIWDFDFACIPGIVENSKVNSEWTSRINIEPEQNRYYDIHYFFNTLIKKGFFSEFLTSDAIPKEAKQFVKRIIPPKYRKGDQVAKKGRILSKDEHMTPNDILMYDPYFEEFRSGKIVSNNNTNKKNRKKRTNTNIKHETLSEILNELRKENKKQSKQNGILMSISDE